MNFPQIDKYYEHIEYVKWVDTKTSSYFTTDPEFNMFSGV